MYQVKSGIIFNFSVSLKKSNYAEVFEEVRLCQVLVLLQCL